MESVNHFNEAIENIDLDIKTILKKINKKSQNAVQEIRLRAGLPLIVKILSTNYYVNYTGELSEEKSNHTVNLSHEQIAETFKKLCQYSLYSYQEEINNGFITLKGGHRAGICGSAVLKNGTIYNVKYITSINIRVAKFIFGISDEILKETTKNGLEGILIAGKPGSGKTTILKDMIRQISSGYIGKKYNISIIDERSEIASVYCGTYSNNLGSCIDIFNGYPKVEGMLTAIRTMAPDIIVCDEIGTNEESEAIKSVLNSGVKVICTIHAGNEEEIYMKPQIRNLIASRAFKKIVILSSGDIPGKINKIITI